MTSRTQMRRILRITGTGSRACVCGLKWGVDIIRFVEIDNEYVALMVVSSRSCEYSPLST